MPADQPIPALRPNPPGHQFVVYADACSGVPGALHERTFAAVNAVLQRLDPQPEFIAFPGDEIRGLTADADELRTQWRYWFEHEMAWLDRNTMPLYHTTANHTTYDPASEAIFREVLAHLPRNGPAGQEGLSYFVRRTPGGAADSSDDLLMIFVNTLWSGLGGEGYVETEWLEQTLTEHADARYKLVFGHHPVFPVNGFVASHQREIAHEMGPTFWMILVRHGVLAYWCSHILAFDVQVHEGVLQILTAGAGTAHRMPEEFEYLHAMQAVLAPDKLRYQVLDTAGIAREWLSWPLPEPQATAWQPLVSGVQSAPHQGLLIPTPDATPIGFWQIGGHSNDGRDGTPQTLFSAWEDGPALAPLWIGLHGREQQLAILLAPQPGRSPHLWTGPTLPAGQPFSLQLAFHSGMGPGGLLWRWDETRPWSSLHGASAWGVERLPWPARWSVGQAQRGAHDRPFRGQDLTVLWQTVQVSLGG
ncbi:MAG: hypothetical protein R2867_35070 [Caldilineaceae bacterium]